MTITPSFAEIVVQGADACTYLHSQLANAVRDQPVGSWGFGSYCQVDGRVQSLFLFACVNSEHFRLVLPNDNLAEIESRLAKFRVRARCAISSRQVEILAAPGQDHDSGYVCDGFQWWLRPASEALPIADSLWSQQLAWGVPWLTGDCRSEFLPAMLSLERLQAFTLKKGCYPGQEILARTHYLGRSKRRLVRIRPGEVAPGTFLVDPEGVERGCVLASDALGGLAVVHESQALGGSLYAAHNRDSDGYRLEANFDDQQADALLNGALLGP